VNPNEKSFSVLVADDSEDDRLFLRIGLRNQPQLKIVAEVEDGEDAINYLGGKGKYADREAYPFPELLVLDLKMPRFSGFEVLDWLRQQDFPDLKVAVVSGSFLKEDVARSLDLGAHAYHLKPSSLVEQLHIAAQLQAMLGSARENTAPAQQRV
jgi:CheY-like chemotaxis protein